MKCNIVIPCAGHAQRFKDADFPCPKPLTRLRGRYMFEWSVDSLEHDHTNLHFVVLQEHVDKFKIDTIINDIYEDAEIHVINEVLPGCVETVLTIQKEIDNKYPLIIQNVDVTYNPKLDWIEYYDTDIDAIILTAESDKDKHSYVRINEDRVAIEFAEKRVISSHAVVGTYYFMRGANFVSACKEMRGDDANMHGGEWYITPSLTYLKQPVKVVDVKEFYPLGTPYDVYEFVELRIDNV